MAAQLFALLAVQLAGLCQLISQLPAQAAPGASQLAAQLTPPPQLEKRSSRPYCAVEGPAK